MIIKAPFASSSIQEIVNISRNKFEGSLSPDVPEDLSKEVDCISSLDNFSVKSRNFSML